MFDGSIGTCCQCVSANLTSTIVVNDEFMEGGVSMLTMRTKK